jgi:C4-dicarboxylate-specific signal transduction histidine kinase
LLLKHKLIVVFLAIELAFLVPIIAIYYNIEKNYNKAVFKENANVQAQILVQAIKTPLSINDVATLDDICEEIIKQELIVGVSIFNANNKKLSSLTELHQTITDETHSVTEQISIGNVHIGTAVVYFNKSNSEKEFTLSFLKLALTILAGAFLASFLAALVVSRLIERKLNEFGETDDFDGINGNDEISKFAKRFIEMTAIAKAKSANLEEFNSTLEIEIAKAKETTQTQERLLAQQSKMAAMGEMIGAIAHQWRQPLNQLSLEKDMLVEDYFFQELTDEKVKTFQNSFNDTLLYMSKTIDDFRNFFMPSKEKVEFEVYTCLQNAANLISSTLKNSNIELEIIETDTKLQLFGHPNEFSQVLINLINNAKDAIGLNKIKSGKIIIEIKELADKLLVEISDNAGGIPDDILDKIFDPYFTTKFASSGTGLGLYMSKNIIEKSMNGELSVRNGTNGAIFTISLKL